MGLIRAAGMDDIPRLMEMGQRFSKKAALVEHVGYDPASMEQTFAALITGGHPIFVSERGAIGGTSTPHPFNHDHIIAQELFWWSEGGDGLRLLKRFEKWCAENCHSLRMLTLEAIEPERTGKLYERMGFKPIERGYIKVF